MTVDDTEVILQFDINLKIFGLQLQLFQKCFDDEILFLRLLVPDSFEIMGLSFILIEITILGLKFFIIKILSTELYKVLHFFMII